jgi:multidrug efflux pump subunit AcrB
LGAWYERGLAGMLRRPIVSVLSSVVLAGVTVALFLSIGTGFLPPADEGAFVIDYLTLCDGEGLRTRVMLTPRRP